MRPAKPAADPMSPSDPIRVYVVDDQTILRSAFCHLLKNDCGFDVVGDSGDARKAIQEIQDLRPDVVTLDVSMPGLSGLDALPKLQKVSPHSQFVMLTSHESGRFLEESLKAGASGFLTKDSEADELGIAIKAVHAGRNYITSRVVNTLVERVSARAPDQDSPAAIGRLAALTGREREVFQMLAVGQSNKEIAHDLDISLGTVKKHRENLQRKLKAHPVAELARIAIQEGLLSG